MASTEQSLSATVSENPKGAPSAVAKTRRLFPAALDAVRQKTRRQAGRDARQMRVVDLRIGAQRSGQPTDEASSRWRGPDSSSSSAGNARLSK